MHQVSVRPVAVESDGLDDEIDRIYAELEHLALQQDEIPNSESNGQIKELFAQLNDLKQRRADRDRRLAQSRLQLPLGEGRRTLEEARKFLEMTDMDAVFHE